MDKREALGEGVEKPKNINALDPGLYLVLRQSGVSPADYGHSDAYGGHQRQASERQRQVHVSRVPVQVLTGEKRL